MSDNILRRIANNHQVSFKIEAMSWKPIGGVQITSIKEGEDGTKYHERFVKNHGRYDSIGDFIDCMAKDLEDYTTGFILLHLFVLFAISFFTWVVFETGGKR